MATLKERGCDVSASIFSWISENIAGILWNRWCLINAMRTGAYSSSECSSTRPLGLPILRLPQSPDSHLSLGYSSIDHGDVQAKQLICDEDGMHELVKQLSCCSETDCKSTKSMICSAYAIAYDFRGMNWGLFIAGGGGLSLMDGGNKR